MNLKMKVLNNILTSDNILDTINSNIEVIFLIIPELKEMVKFDQKNPEHIYSLWNHTLCALGMSPNDLEIRMALLFHDIGKISNYQEEIENKKIIRHYNGHPKESKKITKRILERLEYDENFIKKICYLVEKHDSIITKEEVLKNKDLEYKRYTIQICDIYAHNTNSNRFNVKEKYIEKVKKYF